MKNLFYTTIIFTFCNFGGLLGQSVTCPTSVQISNNTKCISVTPANSSTVISGYTYSSGSNPAIFFENGGNSSGCNKYTGFSGTLTIDGLTCSYNVGVLPVSFSSFNISLDKSVLYLNFSTSAETNNDYFTVERSSDGIDFESIGQINGAGNSAEERNYIYTDADPVTGVSYYRIRQTDFDGKFTYSDVRSARYAGSARYAITPNITSGNLDISTDIDIYDIVVFNSAGSEVSRFSSLSGHQTISIENLRSGMYFIQMSGAQSNETIKVVKY